MSATTTAHPTLDLGMDLLPGDELHTALGELRESGRVVPVRFFGTEAQLVTRFDDVKESFRDDEHLPAGATYQMHTEPVVGRTFISMDGKEHDRHRALATPAFRSRAVARFDEEALLPLAHEIVDRFAARGECDLVAELTAVLPYYAITRKLGVPRASDDDMRAWADAMLAFPSDPDGAVRAADGVLRHPAAAPGRTPCGAPGRPALRAPRGRGRRTSPRRRGGVLHRPADVHRRGDHDVARAREHALRLVAPPGAPRTGTRGRAPPGRRRARAAAVGRPGGHAPAARAARRPLRRPGVRARHAVALRDRGREPRPARVSNPDRVRRGRANRRTSSRSDSGRSSARARTWPGARCSPRSAWCSSASPGSPSPIRPGRCRSAASFAIRPRCTSPGAQHE